MDKGSSTHCLQCGELEFGLSMNYFYTARTYMYVKSHNLTFVDFA